MRCHMHTCYHMHTGYRCYLSTLLLINLQILTVDQTQNTGPVRKDLFICKTHFLGQEPLLYKASNA